MPSRCEGMKRLNVVVLGCVAVLSMSSAAYGQAASDLWLIHNTKGGAGSVQESRQTKWRLMDKYDVLKNPDKIRCDKAPCTLLYLTESGETSTFPPATPKPLPLKVNEVFTVTVPSQQAKSPAGRRAADFQEIVSSV